MKKILLSIISIMLLPLTIIFFLMPLFVFFVSFINLNFVITMIRILIILWITIFLFSIIVLSSYCGILCPMTKIFTLIARITKNNDILKHRFPKMVGVITQIMWLAGTFYVFLRLSGNVFGFLPRERIFSQVELLILFCFYGFASLLLNTRIGKDELGHYLCPISPFIKLGIELNRFFKIPGFRITPDSSLCKNCGQCNRICTYQIDVIEMVKENKINYKLCSNCGKCVSVCISNAIKREWTK